MITFILHAGKQQTELHNLHHKSGKNKVHNRETDRNKRQDNSYKA